MCNNSRCAAFSRKVVYGIEATTVAFDTKNCATLSVCDFPGFLALHDNILLDDMTNMCGIAGKLNLTSGEPIDPALIQRMMDAMNHRGPDGEGKYVKGAVGLGHKRLSIIDLHTGAQPITNEDKTVWIVFNGEIYNYLMLRKELQEKGHRFATMTDTEVIVHAYEEYGFECLQRLRGMFAFAIWDERKQRLFIARDRLGIKPLYYACHNGQLLFGSEIKCLLADKTLHREMNFAAIDRFLTYYYVPGEETLFKHVRKLKPGHFLVAQNGHIECKEYWDLHYKIDPAWTNIEDAAQALSDLLRETVRDHMLSDVPVGFLLSGGLDSTALLRYAVEETDKKIKTFTVGFAGENFADERPYARLAAERFGTEHYETTITAADFRDFLGDYVWYMEEPVCEPPAIALYYVTRLARNHVKVLLSGEGGDEAFGGYPNYRNLLILETLKKGGKHFNRLLACLLRSLNGHRRLQRLTKYAPFLEMPLQEYYFSRSSSPWNFFYQNKKNLYTDAFKESIGYANPLNTIQALFRKVENQSLLNQMLYVDTKTWLPDDLLIKADKMSMANSLELRVPFLDHKVMEFASSLPPSFKVKGTTTKRILKRAFNTHIPDEIVHRRKTGFPVPYDKWMRHELKSYVFDLMNNRGSLYRRLFRTNLFEESKNVTIILNQPKVMFSLLILELWHNKFIIDL